MAALSSRLGHPLRLAAALAHVFNQATYHRGHPKAALTVDQLDPEPNWVIHPLLETQNP